MRYEETTKVLPTEWPPLDPVCINCLTGNGIEKQSTVTTNFGGKVFIWVCLSCGRVAVCSVGGRPHLATSEGRPQPGIKKGGPHS